MKYMHIYTSSFCDGTGVRVVLFVSGCTHKCRGCHNKESWDFCAGKEFTDETMHTLLNLIDKPYIKGLTLSGGDPLAEDNRECVAYILETVSKYYPNKDIWVYTGYTYDEVCSLEIMKNIDILVDGKFQLKKRDTTLPFRGSSNQRLIDVQASLKSGETVIYEV